MPKPKQFLKSENKHKGKKPQPVPETADEFLAAGVDFEAAGEKWRAGDAAKSSRFFLRALEAYQTGLQKFPTAFDLAYNKARVQLDLAQQPRLLKHVPTNEDDLLQQSLEAHRYALGLEPEDANTIFNTAQLLAITAAGLTQINSQEAVPLLKESLQLFDKCLAIQEKQYLESEAQVAALTEQNEEPTPAPIDQVPEQSTSPKAESEEEEQWATVLEPVTKTSLLDTTCAQMQALSLLIPLTSVSTEAVQELDSLTTALLSKAETFLSEEADMISYRSDTAKLTVALARATFLHNLISADRYSQALSSSYSFPELATSPPALCDLAEASIDFNSALASTPDPQTLSLRWEALSSASTALSKAAKLPDAENLAEIHSQRGDVEMLRAKLGEPGVDFGPAVKARGVLLGNAEVYYRGAARLAGVAGDDGAVREAQGREAVARALKVGGATSVGDGGDAMGLEGLDDVVWGMREDGLL